MSATTNTVIATVDAEVPTVPTTLITTAAILIAAKGKGYAKQVKNKMEKTKNTIVGNTTDCYTLVKELYSHSVMLLQQTLFQTENTTSGEEFSTSVGKLMDCIETLSGSIQQNIASLKKIKQKLAQNNKQYIAQSIEFAAIPVDESETTQPPAAKKPRAKKVKESAATEGGVAETTPTDAAAAPAPKKPRAKKVKEPVVAAEAPVTAEGGEPAAEAAAPAPKKPRAKKVKEPVVAAEAPVTAEGGEPAAEAAAPAPKKPRAKKVKEPSATDPAAAAAEAPVTASEAEIAEAVAQAVIEAVEQAVAEAAAKKKPRAKKTKKSSETVATEDATTVTSESEQPQTETIYTVIHPEVTEDSTAPKKTKKTKEPKKTNKSNQTTEPPPTPIHKDAASMTPCAPVKENTTSESIIQNDFVPNHLTFDYEITSEDICRDIELIIDELEEDMISEITAIGK